MAMGVSDQTSREQGRRGVAAVALVVLGVGFTLTAGVVLQARSQIQQSARVRFERLSERLVSEIEQRVNLALYGLNSVVGLYAASSSVERDEFRTFVSLRPIESEFPGVLGFGVIERVPRQRLAAFVAAERATSPGFNVQTSGAAPELLVIKYIEPHEQNYRALGYDIGTDPVRRAAAERAIQSGEPVLTAPISLIQYRSQHIGFLYFVPMYRHGSNPKTPEEREKELVGLAYAPLLVEKIFAGIHEAGQSMLDIDVFAGRVETPSLQMVDTGRDRYDGNLAGFESRHRHRMFRQVNHVTIGGRDWTIVTSTLPAFEATVDVASPALFGAAGCIVSLLLAATLWTLGTARARAVALAHEMTADLELARARADAASRAKSEFLANVSHEIRTPLTAMLGYADLMREEGEHGWPVERRLQTLDTIRGAGKHLLTVVNDILDLSKIEVGKVRVESVDTPLLRLLREVESLMRPRAIARNLRLVARLDSPLPDRVMSDPTRLRQILINLVGNAIKFTETGGATLRARAETRGDAERLVIDIVDTGPGLDAAQIATLFAAFTQADATATRRFGGTGLGLAICRRFAELMGGSVTLARTEVGGGSCFRVDLPLVAVPGAQSCANLEAVVGADVTPAAASAAIALRGRILLAEDSEDNRRLISFHLRKAGAELETAENGSVALAMIEKAEREDRPYDLLVSDMQMPEMDGYTLARTLRQRGNRIAIVALTAHAMPEDRQQCIQAGCDDYATKPIDKHDLLSRCARWIGGMRD
jgi:signal transduction histidine kinase/ActR/RegA family two-component response regulator